MRVLTVVGNRPPFVKAAAVSSRLRSAAVEVLVHRGQHYDDEVSRVFFDELALLGPSTGSTSAAGPTRTTRRLVFSVRRG